MSDERRRMPRYRFSTAVGVDHGTGWTIDVSGNGMLFESSRRFAPGDRLAIVIPLEHDGPGARVTCAAQVVRVQPKGDRYAVAVTYEPIHFNVLT